VGFSQGLAARLLNSDPAETQNVLFEVGGNGNKVRPGPWGLDGSRANDEGVRQGWKFGNFVVSTGHRTDWLERALKHAAGAGHNVDFHLFGKHDVRNDAIDLGFELREGTNQFLDQQAQIRENAENAKTNARRIQTVRRFHP
jgi:hypothetical protein